MFGIRGIRLKVWLSNYYVLKNNNKICPRNSTIINKELLLGYAIWN